MFRKAILIALIISTNTSVSQSKKEQKELQKEENYRNIKALIQSEHYIFKATSTTTQKGRTINVLGNNGTLTINGSIAEANLPYFGVVQMPSRAENGGVNFQNKNITYDIKLNDKKRKITVSFTAKNKNETYTIILTISGKNSADLYVTSSRRNYINYFGTLSKSD